MAEEGGIDLMDYDYTANEDGILEVHILDRKTGERIKDVYLTGLKPYQRLICNLIEGDLI